MHPNTPPTTHALQLYEALKKRNIKSKLEAWDGNKHVDLSIPWAELDIEVDGIQHFVDPDQIHSDLDRVYWSQKRDGFDTIRIPNFLIETNLDQIANAIAQVARDRYMKIDTDRLEELKVKNKNY